MKLVEKESMGEVGWTERIRDILNEHFEGSQFHAETQVKLPYGIMINGFDKNWNADYDGKEEYKFATDLLIYEDKDGKRIPRVVIEAKIRDASTHDTMTYGKKAVLHRELIPYMRYGLMIGANKSEDLTWKHFEHGGDFDFMFSFRTKNPSAAEREKFLELVESEIEISRRLQEMLGTKGKKSDIYYLQRPLNLGETEKK